MGAREDYAKLYDGLSREQVLDILVRMDDVSHKQDAAIQQADKAIQALKLLTELQGQELREFYDMGFFARVKYLFFPEAL